MVVIWFRDYEFNLSTGEECYLVVCGFLYGSEAFADVFYSGLEDVESVACGSDNEDFLSAYGCCDEPG